MSAAAPRRPAFLLRVVRAEAAALLENRATLLFAAATVALAAAYIGLPDPWPYAPVRQLAGACFLLPLLQWRGRPRAGSLDDALPMGRPAHDLVRVAVGAAGAAALLVLTAVTHAWTNGSRFSAAELAGVSRGYPAALVVLGTGFYLLAAAAVLHSRRPASALGLLLVLTLVVLPLAGMAPGTYSRRINYAPDGTMTVVYGAALTIREALPWLAAGVAAVVLSAWLGGRALPIPIPRRRMRTIPAARPPAARAIAAALPRRPAPLAAVARRQLAVLAPRMRVPAVLTLAAALAYLLGGMGMGGFPRGLHTGGFVLLWFAAFFWPLLVWRDERAGDWDAALPADDFARRGLHWAAGLAWLEGLTLLLIAGHVAGAMAEGSPWNAAPAWVLPGVPLAVLAVYCLGTLPATAARHPVAWTLAGWLVAAPLLTVADDLLSGERGPGGAPLAVGRVFAPLSASLTDWNPAAAAIWIPLFVLLALGSLRARAPRRAVLPALAPGIR